MILAMFVLGWIAVNYPLSPAKIKLFVWHKTIGISILILVLLRIAWRLSNPTPVLPSHMRSWERRLAHTSHALMYLVMAAMPLSGWVINSAANFPLKLYGLIRLPNIAPTDKAIQIQAELVHITLFWVFIALLLLHIGAAFWHHFVGRNEILLRMLPGTTRFRQKTGDRCL